MEEQVKDLGIEIIDDCMDSNIVETEKVLPQAIYELTSDFKGGMCILDIGAAPGSWSQYVSKIVKNGK